MPEAKPASLPAADPGSPGFRSVQTRSIFQRVVKPALHSGVAIICAASLAVNAVAMDGDGKRTTKNGDVELGCEITPANDSQCVASTSNGNGASTSGASTSYEGNAASVATVLQTATHATQSTQYELPANQLFESAADMHALIIEVVTHFVALSTTGVGIFSWRRLTTSTLQPGTGVAMTQTLAGAFVILTLGTISQYAIYRALKTKYPGMSDSQRKYIAALPMSVCTAGAIVYIGYVSGLMQLMLAKPKDELRRKLLSTPSEWKQTKGKGGDMMRELAWTLSNLTLDSQSRVTFPAFWGCPSTRVQIPKTLQFGSHDGMIELPAWEFKKVDETGRMGWTSRKSIVFTPATKTTIPVKVVADGDRVWMLSGRGENGYKIFHQLQHSDWKTIVKERLNRWTRTAGEAIDLYPGQNYVWAIRKNQDIYACKQPCNGTWSKVPGKARRVAVGQALNPWGNYKSTKDMPLAVWVLDDSGRVWSRPETDATSTDWTEHKDWDEKSIPQRIRDIFKERDGVSEWSSPRMFSYPDVK